MEKSIVELANKLELLPEVSSASVRGCAVDIVFRLEFEDGHNMLGLAEILPNGLIWLSDIQHMWDHLSCRQPVLEDVVATGVWEKAQAVMRDHPAAVPGQIRVVFPQVFEIVVAPDRIGEAVAALDQAARVVLADHAA